MKRIALITVLILSVVAASAQVRFTATNGESIEMRKSNTTKERQRSTVVFFSPDQVPDSLVQIGVMTVKMNDRAAAIEKAKIYGSRATGDAVLLTEAKDQTAGQAVGRFFIGGGAFKGQYVFVVLRQKKS